MVTERAARFGRSNHLVGIVSAAEGELGLRIGLIMINAGLVYRVGPARLHVQMARELAVHGISSLRFDLSGIGDSDSLAGQSRAGEWVQDVRDAISFFKQQEGIDSIVLFGICAGAVRAYETALKDPRVSGVFLADCYLYRTWKTLPLYYSRRLRSGGNWIDVVRAKIRSLFLSTKNSVDNLEDSNPLDSGPIPKSSYAQGLGQLLSSGTWVAQVISGSFPERYNYAGQFKDGFPQFRANDRISAIYFPDSDHTFTDPQQRLQFIRYIVDETRLKEGRASFRTAVGVARGCKGNDVA